MLKTRLALVRSGNDSSWQSCVSITWNLARAYASIEGCETHVFAIDALDPLATVHSILTYNPDRVVIIDHGTFQPRFMKAWLEGGGVWSRIPLHLHCFGDFPLSADAWVGLEPEMQGLRIRFVTASDASSELIGKLLTSQSEGPVTCPFPIDTSQFRFNEGEGARMRRSLGIPASDFVALYTGRFSLQKNTTLLARLMRSYASRGGRQVTLALAGETDDIGADFLGIEFEPGFYRQHFHDELAYAASDGHLKVVMLGSLGPDALRAAYNAADVFVSLSMHHDEDYGMSPAESLCCGTPVVLTGWGGFHTFPRYFSAELRQDAVHVLPISNTGDNLAVQATDFIAALDDRRDRRRLPPLRSRLAAEASASLSVAATGRYLRKIVEEDPPIFTGFSRFFESLARLNQMPGRFESKRFGDQRYLKLYSAYLTPAEIR